MKQLGVLSPTLFGIYIENLLEKLQDTNAGCYVGPYFVGSLAYADDLVLLSPTKAGLNKLMLTCEKLSRDYKVQYNRLPKIPVLFGCLIMLKKPISYILQ